jgi:hypothetical protein
VQRLARSTSSRRLSSSCSRSSGDLAFDTQSASFGRKNCTGLSRRLDADRRQGDEQPDGRRVPLAAG